MKTFRYLSCESPLLLWVFLWLKNLIVAATLKVQLGEVYCKSSRNLFIWNCEQWIEHKQSLEFEIKQSNVMTNANKEKTNRWTFEQWKMWDHTCWTKKITFNIKKINLTRFSTIRISAGFGQPNSANFALVIFFAIKGDSFPL